MKNILEATGTADGETRALIYSMLTDPDLLLEHKAQAMEIAKRLEYAEHTASDKLFIREHLGVKL